MPPSGYVRSRELAASDEGGGRLRASLIDGRLRASLVDGRPYLLRLTADASDPSSIRDAALASAVLSVFVAAARGAADVDAGGKVAAQAEDGELEATLGDGLNWQSLLGESSALVCTKVTGGITNFLFRVSGFKELAPTIVSAVGALPDNGESIDCRKIVDFDSVLIRIFGAEGMIDRDVETSTYAALCNADIAYRYLARFKNGRVEGWLDGFRPLECADLQHDGTSMEIAKEMARLHCAFEVPKGELRDQHFGTDLDAITVGVWDQLKNWMEQAKGYSEFKTPRDTERVKELDLQTKIEPEVNNFISSFASAPCENGVSGDINAGVCGSNKGKSSVVVFCHNDLLPANIMRHSETNKIQLIDFEYGGSNYAAFDIANHFNEYAGGTSPEENGRPDYSRFPDLEQQKRFCVEYVKTAKRSASILSGIPKCEAKENEEVDAEATDLLKSVEKFVLVNHLYWGLWGVNQAAEEGTEEFDYITYSSNRFNEFFVKKAKWEKKGSER